MSNEYTSGQLVNIGCTFTVSGVVTDPTKVQASFRYETATATTYTYPTAAATDAALVRDSTGVFHFNITAVSAGKYHYRFQGWTACQAAMEGDFTVGASNF